MQREEQERVLLPIAGDAEQALRFVLRQEGPRRVRERSDPPQHPEQECLVHGSEVRLRRMRGRYYRQCTRRQLVVLGLSHPITAELSIAEDHPVQSGVFARSGTDLPVNVTDDPAAQPYAFSARAARSNSRFESSSPKVPVVR